AATFSPPYCVRPSRDSGWALRSESVPWSRSMPTAAEKAAADSGNAPRALRDRLWGVARVAVLTAVVAAAASFWLAHRAHAYGERMLQNMGEHMMRYAGAHHQNTPEQLHLNGATFFLSTGNVRATVEEVVDTFHAKCTQRNGRLREQWAEVGARRGVEMASYS